MTLTPFVTALMRHLPDGAPESSAKRSDFQVVLVRHENIEPVDLQRVCLMHAIIRALAPASLSTDIVAGAHMKPRVQSWTIGIRSRMKDKHPIRSLIDGLITSL